MITVAAAELGMDDLYEYVTVTGWEIPAARPGDSDSTHEYIGHLLRIDRRRGMTQVLLGPANAPIKVWVSSAIDVKVNRSRSKAAVRHWGA